MPHVVRLARMGTMAGMGGGGRNVTPAARDGQAETLSCLARWAQVRRSVLRQIQKTYHGITMNNAYVNHEILSKRWPAIKCRVHSAHYHTTLCNT
jgi:hypothetical protein